MLNNIFHSSPGDAPLWLFVAAAAVLLLALALVVWSALQPDLDESFKTPPVAADDDHPMAV